MNYTNVAGLNKTIFEDKNRGLLIVNHGFAADANSDWMLKLKDVVIKYVRTSTHFGVFGSGSYVCTVRVNHSEIDQTRETQAHRAAPVNNVPRNQFNSRFC